MSDHSKAKRWSLFWLLGAVVLLGIGLASSDLRELFAEAVAKVRPEAVLATFPGQVAAIILYAAALSVLRPGVSYWGCLGTRLLRDAADNLLVFLPGLGEVIGARALVLAGGRSRTAVTVIMVDKVAETAAQLPFMGLAGFMVFRHWSGSGGGSPSSATLPGAAVAGLAFVVVLAWLAGSLMKATEGLPGRLAARIREEFQMVVAEFHQQKSGIPIVIALHFVAWLTDGVQVWMAAHAFNLQLSFFEAVVMASAAYAVRVILFFVPAGLMAQEAGFVTAGLAFGVAAPLSLTLSLVLRLRDVVFGAPLLFWPAYEYRHGRKAGKRSAH